MGKALWMAGVVVLVAGCVNTTETVRRYASFDLRCPVGSITTQQIARGAFMASGCGRRSFYIDNNAASTVTAPPAHTAGQDYVTLVARASR